MKKNITILALLVAGLTVDAEAASFSAQELPDGPKVYVNQNRGAVRGKGTKEEPYKDLQKAVDEAAEGSVICISEGNYLGRMDAGYIEVSKYISLVGGYNDDFSQRDPLKFITKIQPTKAQNATNGAKALLTFNNVKGKPDQLIVVDGIMFDLGQQNNYQPAKEDDPRTGTCKGCETGRITPGGEPNGLSHQLIKGNVQAKLVVRNCLFVNGVYYAIQMINYGGSWEIYNNVFVSNTYASCQVDGAGKGPGAPIDASLNFHHNTVLFSWCRTKDMEDMGYGYRFRNGIHGDVHHNIFGCSNLGALDRALSDSDKKRNAERKTSAYENMFFMNAADLILASPGGGGWTKVPAARFEEAEELAKYEGNIEAPANSNVLKVIDQAYLQGFATLKTVTSQSYDPNSAANQFREAHGLNKQGTSTTRVSMYGNRYDFNKALKLFGAEKNYGAQAIK